MNETIGFRKPTEFLGRNGVAKMAGIHVSRQGDDLYLAPVTSKHGIGRAYMLVPVEMVPDLAKAMLKVCVAVQAGRQQAA